MDDNITYTLIFSKQAEKDIVTLKRSEVTAYNKLIKLLKELRQHPTTGTGRPKLLKYKFSGLYSRRITQKHRLVYKVDNKNVTVFIISAEGHYGDK